MGLFDFFRKSVSTNVSTKMPTIPVPQELHHTYSQVFLAELKTIEAFTSDEALRMLKLIESGDGGHLNQSHYYKTVYEQFFRNRQWSWPWYEHWDAKFNEFGAYPPDWPNCELPNTNPSICKILSFFTVQELKQELSNAGVKFSATANKKALQELATSNDEIAKLIAASDTAKTHAKKYLQTQGYALYKILMQTISSRAKHEFDDARSVATGLTRTKLKTMGTEFDPFVKFVLAENPQARSPLYPGDSSFNIYCLK